MKKFTPGMTLAPGEAAGVQFPILLPPGAGELVDRGQLTLETKQGPIGETAPGRYYRDVEIILGGKLFGAVRLEWETKPLTFWQKFKQKFEQIRKRTEKP